MNRGMTMPRQLQNEDLSSLAEEARTLKDEMDVLRHTSDKVVSLVEAWHSLENIVFCKKKIVPKCETIY